MIYSFNKLFKLFFVIALTILIYITPAPEGLSDSSWHLFAIFIGTVIAIMLDPLPMGVIVMISLAMCALTKTLTLEQSLYGFSSKTAWLVVFSFFIARGLIKSQLGRRAGYFFISKFGKSTLGLSYSLILTEFLISPAIPSASARGGGIIFPIADSLSKEYSSVSKDLNIKGFIMQLCFHTNIITSSMFLTSMAGNPVIATLAQGIGVKITWTGWALAAIVPGIISLLLLPIVLKFITKTKTLNSDHAPALARAALKEMGALSRNELIVLFTFAGLITLWILSEALNIDPATTALVGFLVMIITSVITWEDAMMEKSAWKTFMWFAGFITLSKFLSDMGVTSWVGDHLQFGLEGHPPMLAIPCLMLVFFYMHYLFASITVYASVTYVTFAMIFISLGLSPIIVGFSLAILANLSACITHYGIASAPIFFGGSELSVKDWWRNGFYVSIFHIIVWSIGCAIWWKALGWW